MPESPPTEAAPPTSPPRPPPPGAGSTLNRLFSLLALAIAVVALALTFVIPGPSGATGAQGPAGTNGSNGGTGPQGPPGPGTLMSSTTSGAITNFLNNHACNSYAGGNVTITVPSSGEVVVQAQVWVLLYHDSSNITAAYLSVSSTNNACGSAVSEWPIEMLAGEASGDFFAGAYLQGEFSVTAGAHTYYISGEVSTGWNSVDQYYFDNMVAVFYPS
jgi:hypothetical protein